MAIPPPDLWPVGAQGDQADPYVVGYMATAAWLFEIPSFETDLHASPRAFNAYSRFPPCDCVEVEVRFRSRIENRSLRQARMDSGPPLPEVVPLREAAHEGLLVALTILRGVLEERARRGLYGAAETLNEQIWFADSMLNCFDPGRDFRLYRVPMERALNALERGAYHLDLPPDFWRTLLIAADNLGLFHKHFQFQKLLAALGAV